VGGHPATEVADAVGAGGEEREDDGHERWSTRRRC